MNKVVKVATGSLRGAVADGVQTFRGIPYAAPPTGAQRWQAPGPPLGWTGERDATQFGPDPLQPPNPRKQSRATSTSEDCLTLNLWAPETGGPYPVMVWFEGGSFVTGTGADAKVDSTTFAQHGVVVVTCNYRLGAFGYLAHRLLTQASPHGASGNYGMMDQLAVLRWVRENIAAFGGDAANITIFGVSAGSASVALMLTAPQARGLFDKAIMQSPGSLRPLASLELAQEYGEVVGTDLAAMRGMPGDQLLALNPKIGPPVRGLTTPRILRPIHDGYVIPQEEYDAYQAGNFAPVPSIVGCTANEGAWFVGELPVNTVAEYEAYIRKNFGESTDEALRLYPVRSDADVKPALAAVFGDTQFTYGTRGLARAISGRQPKTFRYLFAHGTAGHADDTSYIFGTEDKAVGKSDVMISDAMMRYWVQFATTGDPNVGGLPPWPAYDIGADNFLKFGAETIAVDRGWHTETLDFIDRYLHPRVPSM